MTAWKIDFILETSDVPAIEMALWDAFEAVCLFEEENNPKFHIVEITHDGEPDRAALGETLHRIFKPANIPMPDLNINPLPDVDWLEHVYQQYPPVDAGRFYVHGSHITDLPKGRICLCVDAATAFGTGEHGTTKGCLLALDTVLEDKNDADVLDMGCGSGILAMAAAKVLNRNVIAVDNDNEAVRVTMENARTNGLADFISAQCGDGFHIHIVGENAPYDIITANILAAPLMNMAPDLMDNLALDGVAILSGLYQTQTDMVLKPYTEMGLTLIDQYPIGEWQTLVLKKDKK